MKHQEKWQPNKFVYRDGKLSASHDTKEVGIASRLSADIIASFYDANLKEHARGRLLDLGCGKVPLYEAYKPYVNDNICVDWGNTRHKNEYLDFECDLTKVLPFENGAFDTIILSDVLEHIPQPEQLWSEMSRILAPGGKIIMNVPFFYWLHEQPHDYYRYTEYALKRFVENAGLTLVKLERTGGAPEILTDILAKHVKSVPLIGKPLAAGLQRLTMVFLRLGVGRKISQKTARNFPYGYFLVAGKG